MNQVVLPQTHSRKVTSLTLSGFALTHNLAKFAMTLEKWRLRQKSRMELARIDKHTLRDIGIRDATWFIAMNELYREE